jgi:acyl carrier protein
VLTREQAPGDKYLVAYVVANHDQTITVSELRDFLKQRVPNYMLPSDFMFLDSLPLTPNSKIDHDKLPLPDDQPELRDAFVAPRTQVEKQLAAIWSAVLQLEQVGIDDNFFDLGGHSLLATQIVSRAREAFHVDLTVRSLFENPTLAGLAVHIADARLKGLRRRNETYSDEPRFALR